MTFPNPPRRGLTADELDDVTRATVDRLNEILPDIDQRTWRDGMTWYFNAHGIASGFGRLFGLPARQAAAIIAALSPRCDWDSNVDDAKLLMETGDEYGYMALGANVAKALWLRDGDDPESVLGGRKVRSFYRNVYRPTTSYDVTIDSWMLFALDRDLDHKYLERKGIYDAISTGFRIVAERKGVYPHQLQAAVWLHFRERSEK